MPQLQFKNTWAAQGSGTDQQRSDLFQVMLNFPAILNVGGGTPGVNLWESECNFAVSAFPFPERTRNMIPIKYLNQTNYMLGADDAAQPINLTVRYAFNRRTAELLERWHWLTSNPQTGGVALTSAVKSNGFFYWLVPNMGQQANIGSFNDSQTLSQGGAYYLEGCLVHGLKPSDASMDTSAGSTLAFSLQVDRYYPLDVTDLTVTDLSGFFSGSPLG